MLQLCASLAVLQEWCLWAGQLCSSSRRVCSLKDSAPGCAPCLAALGEGKQCHVLIPVEKQWVQKILCLFLSYIPGALSSPLISRSGSVLQSHSSSIWAVPDVCHCGTKLWTPLGWGLLWGELHCCCVASQGTVQHCRCVWSILCGCACAGCGRLGCERFPWEQQWRGALSSVQQGSAPTPSCPVPGVLSQEPAPSLPFSSSQGQGEDKGIYITSLFLQLPQVYLQGSSSAHYTYSICPKAACTLLSLFCVASHL